MEFLGFLKRRPQSISFFSFLYSSVLSLLFCSISISVFYRFYPILSSPVSVFASLSILLCVPITQSSIPFPFHNPLTHLLTHSPNLSIVLIIPGARSPSLSLTLSHLLTHSHCPCNVVSGITVYEIAEISLSLFCTYHTYTPLSYIRVVESI